MGSNTKGNTFEMRIANLLISLLILLLSGCTQIPIQEHPSPTFKEGVQDLEHNKKLINLHSWRAEGRLIAIHKSEAIHASFIWEQQGPLYKIRFFGPLGMSGGVLMGNTDTQEVIFKTAQGKRLEASSAEKLIYQNTGLYFPVSHISYWIKGLPDPNYNSELCIYNTQGLLENLRQQAWNIQYVDYINSSQDDKLFLPAYVKIKSKQTTLKISVSAWH